MRNVLNQKKYQISDLTDYYFLKKNKFLMNDFKEIFTSILSPVPTLSGVPYLHWNHRQTEHEVENCIYDRNLLICSYNSFNITYS